MRSSDSLCNSIDALRSINPINDRLVSQYRIGSVSSSRLSVQQSRGMQRVEIDNQALPSFGLREGLQSYLKL